MKPARLGFVVLLAALILLACGDDDDDDDEIPAGGPFTLTVAPASIPDVAPGQVTFLLVSVEDGNEPVALSAKGKGASTKVTPAQVRPGELAEVEVSIDRDQDEGTVEVEVTAKRGSTVRTETVTMTAGVSVIPALESAEAAKERFVAWLANERPELGITPETKWKTTVLRPHILVVSYLLFYNEQWEMAVWWHVMIAPHDWARTYLRERFVAPKPGPAFEISSMSDASAEPHDYVHDEGLWR